MLVEVTVTVTMKRLNRPGKEGLKVYSPRFPKPKVIFIEK